MGFVPEFFQPQISTGGEARVYFFQLVSLTIRAETKNLFVLIFDINTYIISLYYIIYVMVHIEREIE